MYCSKSIGPQAIGVNVCWNMDKTRLFLTHCIHRAGGGGGVDKYVFQLI